VAIGHAKVRSGIFPFPEGANSGYGLRNRGWMCPCQWARSAQSGVV